MNDIVSAGSVENAGLTRPLLRRLNPREIAVLVLPGTNTMVMDASDEQFQALVASAGIPVNEAGFSEWSFDDRIGIINHTRSYGIDLFAAPNKNNSSGEQKQFGNNSPAELFEGSEPALQEDALSLDVSMESRVQSVRNGAKKSSDGE